MLAKFRVFLHVFEILQILLSQIDDKFIIFRTDGVFMIFSEFHEVCKSLAKSFEFCGNSEFLKECKNQQFSEKLKFSKNLIFNTKKTSGKFQNFCKKFLN